MTGTLLQLLDIAELDRGRRAGLGAGRRHVVFEAVVAERALVGRPRLELAVLGGAVDASEGTARHAETAAVADVLLDIHRVVLGPDQCPRRAGLEAGRIGAVLAAVRQHPPALILPARIGLGLFDELDVAPAGGPQRSGVVVTVARHRKAVGGQLIPLLARHLAGLAADAEAGVGEEAPRVLRRRWRLDVHQPLVAVDHRWRPFWMLHMNALSSWM